MFRRKNGASANDATRQFRPLPPKPNLELERKRAKTLLAELHQGDPAAIARARTTLPAKQRAVAPSSLQLADAQLIIAREFGFAGWPRLVRYFEDLSREPSLPVQFDGFDRNGLERMAEGKLEAHRAQRTAIARELAGFVPRFYGMAVADVLTATVTLEDTRLAVARYYHCTGWADLLVRVDAERARRADPWTRYASPFAKLGPALYAEDTSALAALLDEYPELRHPSEHDIATGRTVAFQAVHAELKERSERARRMSDWLESQGIPVNENRSRALCGGAPGIYTADQVRYLLDGGADPSRLLSNGISVLEHALVRHQSREVVELIASRVIPRDALWIAAGLGDIDGMRRFFDQNGKPTSAAYEDRPKFGLVGPRNHPSLPEPEELDILSEVACVAAWNEQVEAVAFLIDRGLPIDHRLEGSTTMLYLAIQIDSVALVEYLVDRGASLDARGWHPASSAREYARSVFARHPDRASTRRILELCGGGDPVLILANNKAPVVTPPQPSPRLLDAFTLAGDDAARREQREIEDENLFVGILRTGGLELGRLVTGGLDLLRLRASLGDRLLAQTDIVVRPKFPVNERSRAAIQRAVLLAAQMKSEDVAPFHLLHTLLDDREGGVATWIVTHGGRPEKVQEMIAMLGASMRC